jgi:hypothetical protein
MTAKLYEARPDLVSQRKRRRIAGKAMSQAISTHGNDLTGFALVTWNSRGDCHSSYLADYGPISRSLMPSYVKDALQRHVTINMAESLTPGFIDGDEPA